MITTDIREYNEELSVDIATLNGRFVIIAKNQGGFDSVQIDLEDVIVWIKNHLPLIYRGEHHGQI